MIQPMNDRQAWELATRNAAQNNQARWDEVTAMRAQRGQGGGAA